MKSRNLEKTIDEISEELLSLEPDELDKLLEAQENTENYQLLTDAGFLEGTEAYGNSLIEEDEEIYNEPRQQSSIDSYIFEALYQDINQRFNNIDTKLEVTFDCLYEMSVHLEEKFEFLHKEEELYRCSCNVAKDKDQTSQEKDESCQDLYYIIFDDSDFQWAA